MHFWHLICMGSCRFCHTFLKKTFLVRKGGHEPRETRLTHVRDSYRISSVRLQLALQLKYVVFTPKYASVKPQRDHISLNSKEFESIN